EPVFDELEEVIREGRIAEERAPQLDVPVLDLAGEPDLVLGSKDVVMRNVLEIHGQRGVGVEGVSLSSHGWYSAGCAPDVRPRGWAPAHIPEAPREGAGSIGNEAHNRGRASLDWCGARR